MRFTNFLSLCRYVAQVTTMCFESPDAMCLEVPCPYLWSRGLRFRTASLGCWDCGFDCRREHGCLPLVIIVCCQVEVSASNHSSGGILTSVLFLSDISKFRERRGHDRNKARSTTGRKRIYNWRAELKINISIA